MITTKQLADAMKRHGHTRVGAYVALRELLIESLAPREKIVYEIVWGRDHESMITTANSIADAMQISLQDASTILKHLYDYGLLRRSKVTDAIGQHWEYLT